MPCAVGVSGGDAGQLLVWAQQGRRCRLWYLLKYVSIYGTTYIWETLDFCPSPKSLKRTKKLFSDYGLDTTETDSVKVSDGVGVVKVQQIPWMGVQTQLTCML